MKEFFHKILQKENKYKNKKNTNRKSFKGYTLTEMVVVLAILAILSVSTFVSINYFNSQNGRMGLETLGKAMDAIRYETMSSSNGSVYATIVPDGSNWVCKVMKKNIGSDEYEVCKKYEIVDSKFGFYVLLNDNDKKEYKELKNLNLYFNSGDGSIKKVEYKYLELDNTIGNIDEESVTSLSFKISSFDDELVFSPLTGRSQLVSEEGK